MSRSGYTEDCEGADLAMWRGAVASAVRGKRGQAFLAELVTALDAIPEKRLGANALRDDNGDFCALGTVGNARGLNLAAIDPEDRETVAESFGIATAMAAEIMFENDECVDSYKWVTHEICGPVRPNWPDWWHHTKQVRIAAPDVEQRRWRHMRNWALAHLKTHNAKLTGRSLGD